MDTLAIILIFAAAMIALLVVARGLFAIAGRWEGYNLTDESVRHDNPAMGIRFAGFLFAFVLCFSQVLPQTITGTAFDFAWLGLSALLVIVTLYVSGLVTDLLMLHGLNVGSEIIGGKNVAVAVVEAAVRVATAFVISATLVGIVDNPVESLTWYVIGQALLVAMGVAYRYAVPGLFRMLGSGNLACAVSLGGLLVASGMALGLAISGPSQGWAIDLQHVSVFMGGWLVFVAIGDLVSNRLMFPGFRLRSEVTEEANFAAGILEGVIFVSLTMLYGYLFA